MEFRECLASSCHAHSIRTPENSPAILRGNNQGSIEKMVEEIVKLTNGKFNKPNMLPDLVFFFHDGTNPLMYRATKFICECKFGIPSQCMIMEKSVLSNKGQQQYRSNVALKINLKLEGFNWHRKMWRSTFL
jgi:eukaryotic translation initiation factor 2C